MTHVKESEYLAAQSDLPPFNYAYLYNIINVFRMGQQVAQLHDRYMMMMMMFFVCG
jgi:hypothetical protein